MRINPGDVISYSQMCLEEGFSLQKGMNYKVRGRISVILMSLRKGAPYADRVEENGKILIYEGHNVPKNLASNPKSINQVTTTPAGKLTENGKFEQAAKMYKSGKSDVEIVKVYEKIKDGIWVYNGIFELIGSWKVKSEGRQVFKFKLRISDGNIKTKKKVRAVIDDLEHNRMIPTSVKLEVWKRDKGKCKRCGSTNNLHFDHILPFSKGGTSLKVENIQLLCARHNLKKRDKIQ
jgi:hypothetical protein